MSRARVWNVSCWRTATPAKRRNANSTIAQATWPASRQVRADAPHCPLDPTSDRPGDGAAASRAAGGVLGTAGEGTAPDYRPPPLIRASATMALHSDPLGGGQL